MDRAQRCPRCDLSPARCICAGLPTVRTRTRIVVVRHGRELRKPSGTARIAALAMPELVLWDYRDEHGESAPLWLQHEREIKRTLPVWPPEEIGRRLGELERPCLLFPTGRPLSEIAPPRTLVVLDGTWRQARAMYQRIEGVAALPQARLEGMPAGDRLRRPVRPGERSTLEAIADAIAVLEGEEAAAPLRDLHARFVGAAVSARWGPNGRPPRR
jgi:DTW domain-containing protein YfiP